MELKPKQSGSKRSEIEEQLESHLRGLLEPGEELLGSCTGSWQKSAFSQAVVTLGTTDRRLIIQTLDRKGRVKQGEVAFLARPEIESVKVDGAGGSWDSPSSVIMANSTIKLKLKTTGGEKYKFMLLHGGGMIGAWGGGESQKAGVNALMSFLGEYEPGI